MLFPIFLFSQPKEFNARSIVAGNWSTSSNSQFHVLYFIPIKGFGHFQALLNDKFLDIWILSKTTVRVTYEALNFTLSISHTDGPHPFGSTQLSKREFLDVAFVSRSAIGISVVDIEIGSITHWGVIRPRPTMASLSDTVKVAGFLALSFYLFKKVVSAVL